MFSTSRSTVSTARWLLALTVFTVLAAGPTHYSLALGTAAPGHELCRVGAAPPATPAPTDPADRSACPACAFCAAPGLALPPVATSTPEATTSALRPLDRTLTSRGATVGVVARARGPPVRA